MKAKSVIAIDIDDVIADSTESLRLLVNKRVGADLTAEQYFQVGGDYYRYYERVWRAHGLEDKINYETYEAEMIADQSHVPLLPGAEFAINELSKRFHVVFITAREKTWEEATRRWFRSHFKDEVELYFCETFVDAHAKTKGELCKELGATWLIDDNASHCKSALTEGVNAILFGNYGWQGSAPKGLVRCREWPEVLEYLSNVS